eukprot:797428_1
MYIPYYQSIIRYSSSLCASVGSACAFDGHSVSEFGIVMVSEYSSYCLFDGSFGALVMRYNSWLRCSFDAPVDALGVGMSTCGVQALLLQYLSYQLVSYSMYQKMILIFLFSIDGSFIALLLHPVITLFFVRDLTVYSMQMYFAPMLLYSFALILFCKCIIVRQKKIFKSYMTSTFAFSCLYSTLFNSILKKLTSSIDCANAIEVLRLERVS